MKTYYIFRHGETFATKAGTGYGIRVFSAPILPEARTPLEKMGKYLAAIEDSYNISSEVLRCRQTVAIIAEKSGKSFVFDKRLNEFFLESYGHFKKRLQAMLDAIEKESAENILICTHGAGIAGLISLLTPKKDMPGAFDVFHYPAPGILTIIQGETVKEVNFNTPV